MELLVEDIVWLGVVTMLAAYQLGTFASRVGKCRTKHKIEPPSIDGPPDFQRIFRAQQNCLEFFPMFLSSMWMAGIFFHQVPAAVCGLVYLYARGQYFTTYSESAKNRVGPFKLSVKMLVFFLGMAATGITHVVLRTYLGIDLKAIVFG